MDEGPNKDILIKCEEIIDNCVEVFLQRIHNLSDLGPFRRYRRVSASFQMFEPAVPEYYEYRYFEKSLESYIREELVNIVIPQLFELHEIECLIVNHEGKDYINYSNESIEDIYPFEFIIETDNKKFGYRYTSPFWSDEDIKEIFDEYGIQKVEIIDWSDAEAASSSRISWGIPANQRKRFINVSAKEFFISYFSTEEYRIFIKKIKEAVAEANKEIGFTTIPNLSLSYLSKFKAEETKILSDIKFNELVFKEARNNQSIRNRLNDQDYYNLDERFVRNNFYKALVGSEKFAVSFITSEYLYQILKDGGQFDYTAVVCGYIKSIEQLLYNILKITLTHLGGRQLWIKPEKPNDSRVRSIRIENPNNHRSWLIPFEEQYESLFDITLGSMIWFVNDNEHGWYLSENGIITVRRYLLNFSKEDRNEHFHKDNISDFSEVERIRNNTLVLMYLLIGGYKLTDILDTDRELLGVYDDNFDRMYKRMSEVPSGRGFYLQFKNEDEIKVIRMFDQERPIYDNQGSLKNSSIRFVKVEQFGVDYEEIFNNLSEENVITLNKDHVPERIWLVVSGGKRLPIEW